MVGGGSGFALLRLSGLFFWKRKKAKFSFRRKGMEARRARA
jgi:hypothetical protein